MKRPADAITIGFILFFSSLALLFSGTVPSVQRLLITYLILLLLQFLMIGLSPDKGFLKHFHDLILPVITVLLVFDSMTELTVGVNPGDIDYKLIRADYWLLGLYPTVWVERVVTPVITEILQLGYTSYYFLPVILGITLKVRGRNSEFDNSLALIILCFYLSYVGYVIFPALGPRYVMNHLQTVPLQGVALYEYINDFLNAVEGIKRDAFPSGHTAITLVVLHLAFRYERRLFYIFLPLVILLITATVYCRYHYLVDVLAGIGLYILTMALGRWLVMYRSAK